MIFAAGGIFCDFAYTNPLQLQYALIAVSVDLMHEKTYDALALQGGSAA